MQSGDCKPCMDIRIIESRQIGFDHPAARQLYEKNKTQLDDAHGFDWQCAHSFFWNVYDADRFIGCVFAWEEDGRVWIGGCAMRKSHRACVAALKKIMHLFGDVYAKTPHLNAVICLKSAGFEWFDRERGILIFRHK